MNINYADSCNFKPIPAITPLDGYWQNGTWKFGMSEISAGASSQPSWIDVILKGNTALTLVNAKENGLNYLTLFGGTEQRNLPKGYTQYEYLRSSGTQYIDLGYKGKANTKVEVKFRYYQTSSVTGSGRVFGSRTNSSTNAFAIGSSSGVVASTGNKVFWCYDGQSFYVSDNTFALDEWQTVIFSATEHTINGTTEGDDYTVTTFETPSNLMLFAFDNNGTIGCGYVDIAYCKLWDDDGTLVRNVVPAGSGTTYSMYDKVSNTLLPNAGSGDFSVGNAVVPQPSAPMNIWCNNGVVKYSKNMCDVKEENVDVGHYISAQGVLTDNENNFTYIQYIPVKPNTTYTLSFSSPIYFASISEYSTAEDSGFVKRNTYYSVNTGNPPYDLVQCTVTTSSTTNYIRWGSNMYKSTAITIDDVLAVNYMFEIGSTPTAYVPYVEGGIYTDGTTETVAMIAGNIISSDITGANINSVGKVVSSAKVIHIAPVVPGETYTCDSVGIIAYFTDIPVMGSVSYDNSRVTTTNPTFTVPNDSTIKYVAFSNDTATSYCVQGSVLYNGGTATAQDLYKVGTYQDVQSVLDGAVTRNVGIKVLNGTENIGKSGLYAGSFFIRNVVSSWGTSNNAPVYCTHFTGVTAEADYNAQGKCMVLNNAFNMWWASDNTSTLEDFTNWLKDQYNSGNPVIVIYPLATAVSESVTPQSLTTQAGTNIVEITQASMDSLPLEVSYKAGVTVTVTEVQNAQLDNSVEVTIG